MLRTLQQIYELLTRRERRQLRLLGAVIMVMALGELAGVGSILPFMRLVSDPNVIRQDQMLAWLYSNLDFTSERAFLIASGVGVIVIIVVSNAITTLGRYALIKFGTRRTHTVGRRLLAHYMALPYEFFINRNSSDLAKNILSEVTRAVDGVMVPFLELIAKGVVIVLILAFTFLVDPLLSLVVFATLGGAYAILFVISRHLLRRSGRSRADANEQRYRHAVEALAGVKELRLLGREQEFINRFSRNSALYAKHEATGRLFQDLPKYTMDAVAFSSIVVIVLYLLQRGETVEEVLPTLSLYAVAGYRIMPALQKVFRAAANLRFNSVVLEILLDEFRQQEQISITLGEADVEEESAPEIVTEEPTEIELQRVGYLYPDTENWAVRDVSLRVGKNEMIGIVGSTGSGKTTLVDVLMGLLRHKEGRILVNGNELRPETIPSWQRRIGYVPQAFFLSDASIQANIALGIPEESIDPSAIEQAAKIANIDEFIRNQLPKGYHTVVGERGIRLSGGQRQRVGIARALYHDPPVVILDEATSALDTVTERQIMGAIDNLAGKKTLIIIAHRLSTVKKCDTILVLEQGRPVGLGQFEELADSNPYFKRMIAEGM